MSARCDAQDQRLYSADGTVYLVPQGDGNLVLCAPVIAWRCLMHDLVHAMTVVAYNGLHPMQVQRYPGGVVWGIGELSHLCH